ncbi:MAG: STAS domain-containing protein [Acidimicrobiia bacterium]|nr:STAS domain-containing protein [Acidimicrobiia bacterium]
MTFEVPRLELRDEEPGTLVLVGEIDSYTAPMLAERMERGDVDVLDLAGVTFLDSSGLRLLVDAHQTRADAGSSLLLRSPSAPVQRLLEISGLTGYLDVSS